jgi:hypothetical protein
VDDRLRLVEARLTMPRPEHWRRRSGCERRKPAPIWRSRRPLRRGRG